LYGYCNRARTSNVLTDDELKDIDDYEMFGELFIFSSMISEETLAFQALLVLKKNCGSYPNISIALQIVLMYYSSNICWYGKKFFKVENNQKLLMQYFITVLTYKPSYSVD